MSTYLLVDDFESLLSYSHSHVLCHLLVKLCLQVTQRLIIIGSDYLFKDIDNFFQVLCVDGKSATLQESQVLFSHFVVHFLETEVLVTFKHWLLELDVMLRLFEDGLVVKLSTHHVLLLRLIVILSGSGLCSSLCPCLLNLARSRPCCSIAVYYWMGCWSWLFIVSFCVIYRYGFNKMG